MPTADKIIKKDTKLDYVVGNDMNFTYYLSNVAIDLLTKKFAANTPEIQIENDIKAEVSFDFNGLSDATIQRSLKQLSNPFEWSQFVANKGVIGQSITSSGLAVNWNSKTKIDN